MHHNIKEKKPEKIYSRWDAEKTPSSEMPRAVLKVPSRKLLTGLSRIKTKDELSKYERLLFLFTTSKPDLLGFTQLSVCLLLPAARR